MVQRNRSNVPAVLYYKWTIGIYSIDILLHQLQTHFSADNCRPVNALLRVKPSLLVQLYMLPWRILSHGMMTCRFLSLLESEVSRKSDEADLPGSIIKSLISADPDCIPNIRLLLLLWCTVPITYAEAEHSLYVLRLIKNHLTCLRSWMADTRFSDGTYANAFTAATLIRKLMHICPFIYMYKTPLASRLFNANLLN